MVSRSGFTADETTTITIKKPDSALAFPLPPAPPPEAGTEFIDEPIVGFFDDFPKTGTVIIKK